VGLDKRLFQRHRAMIRRAALVAQQLTPIQFWLPQPEKAHSVCSDKGWSFGASI
jgi:hypothetical protein